MTVVVMNNITTIGLTLYISALPVTDRIKALKVAAEAISFSFFLILVWFQEALCSVINHLTNVSLVFSIYNLKPKSGVVTEKLIVSRLLREL